MLKYPCLVLDHDDTVVQSMKTLSYPFFCYILQQFRPGCTMTQESFIQDCHELGFADLCRLRFNFTDAELHNEHNQWMNYIRSHTPAPYPGIDRILTRQKEAGGILCVVSHSSRENILRDYSAHFSVTPDAIYGWELPEEQRKPNPYPLQNIMERYGFSPEELLVVDDMKLSWKMAQPFGIKTAYAAWGEMGVPELEKEMTGLCDFRFDSTKDLEKFLFGTLDKYGIIPNESRG